MKYIKQINEWLPTESDSDEYYQRISEEDFYGAINYISIDKSEMDAINDLIKKSEEKQISYLRVEYRRASVGSDIGKRNSVAVIFKYYRLVCKIYKFEDEWFYVNMSNKYYKCDQFSGLLRFLDDKILS